MNMYLEESLIKSEYIYIFTTSRLLIDYQSVLQISLIDYEILADSQHLLIFSDALSSLSSFREFENYMRVTDVT